MNYEKRLLRFTAGGRDYAGEPFEGPLRKSDIPDPIKKRKRDIRKKDRAFQSSGENHWCAVGHYSEQTCWHHLRGRRHMDTRWDTDNAIRLCLRHHNDIHTLGESTFKEDNPTFPTPKPSWID